MATISPQPRFRAFDSNGDPLSGGLLYTYESGTTTPKATFTTEEGDVSNANPVVLDSDGYADVWLGDGGYKFVLKTSTDVTIWTVDDLGGASSIAFGATVNTISTNTAITSLYANSINICTASPTLSLLSVTSAGEGFYFSIKNDGAGIVTIDPDAAETIDGSSTKALAAGESALIICNGTTWYSLFLTPVTTEFSDSTFRIQDNTDATKEIAFEASSITAGTTRTATFPDKDGTLAMTDDIVTVSQANQAAVESETDEDSYVPPDLLRFSPSSAKFWVNFNGTGTPAVRGDYNVDSITDNGVGDYTIVITDDFSDTNYCVNGTSSGITDGSNDQILVCLYSTAPLSVGSVRIRTAEIEGGTNGNVFDDPEWVCVTGYGDQ